MLVQIAAFLISFAILYHYRLLFLKILKAIFKTILIIAIFAISGTLIYTGIQEVKQLNANMAVPYLTDKEIDEYIEKLDANEGSGLTPEEEAELNKEFEDDIPKFEETEPIKK
jgi:hypothetical protein